jgi:hypothetical protein
MEHDGVPRMIRASRSGLPVPVLVDPDLSLH